jgi:N-methylhydantoinase B
MKLVLHGGALMGFTAALAHMTDIGGRIPGGNASDSTEVYQEGLRIPSSRIWHQGEPDENLFRIIERNVCVPDKVIGDIRSLIAACVVGERDSSNSPINMELRGSYRIAAN